MLSGCTVPAYRPAMEDPLPGVRPAVQQIDRQLHKGQYACTRRVEEALLQPAQRD